jgi:hypothetical protein
MYHPNLLILLPDGIVNYFQWSDANIMFSDKCKVTCGVRQGGVLSPIFV